MNREYFESIYIPLSTKPFQFSLFPNKICDELKCTNKLGIPLSYLDWFGYRLWLYCESEADDKGLPLNEIATQLTKEKGPVYGPVIITDEEKELTMEMFEQICEIAKIIPIFIWQPENGRGSLKLSGIQLDYFKYQTQQYQEKIQELSLDKNVIMEKLLQFFPKDLTKIRF